MTDTTTLRLGLGPDERHALELARHGDLRAFDELVAVRMTRVLRLALSILGNEADARDVSQDAFLQAWRQLPKLRDVDRFDAWLMRIVVNGCRDIQRSRYRSGVREIPADLVAADDEPASSGSTGDDLASADTIQRAFRRLSVEDRSILALHHVDERPVAEIAALLRIPVGTAKWRLHRARGALERAMELESR